MGQKVNPIGLRLGINKTWKSKWYVDPRNYADTLLEDLKIRDVILNSPEVEKADIADVEIVRQPQKVTVFLQTSRPGALIGPKGQNIEVLTGKISKITTKKVSIKIKEVKKPEANAQLLALNVAKQLKSRAAFRKVLKQSAAKAIQAGALGVKIKISGRIGGAEMSRMEQYKEGRIPLHTLRADIDYGFAEADTTFGKIGVKVWIFNGLIFKTDMKEDAGELVRNEKPATRRKRDA